MASKKLNLFIKFYKNGNIKVGNNIWTFSKLAGSGVVNGVKGTCGKYCEGCYNPNNPNKSLCYAVKTYGYYPSTRVGHARNTLDMRVYPRESFEALDGYIRRARKLPVAIRIHASGEIETPEELKAWFKLARKHPNLPFYIYTKAYDIVDKVLSTTNIPSNFYLNISIWHEFGIACYNRWKHRPNVRAFVYEDGYEYPFKADVHCPAYKTGKLDHRFTCDKCKLCFEKKNKICFCHDH